MDLVRKNYLKAEDFKGKVVFWDLDGVLSPYRFNGHIMHNDIHRNATDEEVEAGVFRDRIPCKHVQNIVESIDAKAQLCITQYISEKEVMDKISWISEHYPRIKNTVTSGVDDIRCAIIKNYCKANGIDINDVILIDDDIRHLSVAEEYGIESWHISSLMDFYECK